MDYKSLEEWEKELKESALQRQQEIMERALGSKQLLHEPYLEWAYGIKHREPSAYYTAQIGPRTFPELWATLPFYKQNLVEIPYSFRSKMDFYQYFGMDVGTFKVLCEYDRIVPLVGAPTSYRSQHFLDPILRKSPPCVTINGTVLGRVLVSTYMKEHGEPLEKAVNSLFPKNRYSLANSLCQDLFAFGYGGIPIAVVKALLKKRISRRMAARIVSFAFFYYVSPLLVTGGTTQILDEPAANFFESLGFDPRISVTPEVRKDLLKWLGFRLPKKIDRKYVSKYIEICDDISPSLSKVVERIENRLKGHENARSELKIILTDLESELLLITKRREIVSGAFKWLSALPLSIGEDLLEKSGFKSTKTDLQTAKRALKGYVGKKLDESERVGELIATLTRKGYLVKNVWRIKRKTEALNTRR